MQTTSVGPLADSAEEPQFLKGKNRQSRKTGTPKKPPLSLKGGILHVNQARYVSEKREMKGSGRQKFFWVSLAHILKSGLTP